MSSVIMRIDGDEEFVRRLKLVALRHNAPMKRLIRAAIDEKFGDEIANAEVASFFVNDGACTHHTDEE